jgi:hypothetical protein
MTDRMDKRKRLTLGALALSIVVVAGGGTAMLVYRAHMLNAQGKAFVANAVPAIAASWSKKQLIDRATPELRNNLSPEDLAALADQSPQLGPFEEYQGATGKADWLALAGLGGSVTSSYVAKARFRNGLATFQIALVRRDGHWMIAQFHVDLLMFGPPGRGLLPLGSPGRGI